MLPFRNGGSRKWGASGAIFVAGIVSLSVSAAQADTKKNKSGKADSKASPALTKGAPSPVGGIPMPIGHEIKGLVLPDFDLDGHLRTRFEASTAKRLDTDRIEFKGLKVTSFTPENTIDLQLDLPVSTFNLNTRVLESQARTTITRSDFTISGDTLQFNTNERNGTLTGSVKMVISDPSKFAAPKKPK
jgi:hypothetical protein